MSFAKSKLKLARDSIGRKDFATARDAASQVLEYEPDNYTAHVYLGLALFKLDELDEGEQVYRKAIQLAPQQILAWQGLSQFYESTRRQDKLLETLENIAELHAKAHDPTKTAEVVQKIIDISRDLNDGAKLVKALSHLLPESPFYPTLSRLPPPDPTAPTATTITYIQTALYNEIPVLEEIVGLIESQESSDLHKEVERRRMRLGAGGLEQIRKEVGREIWAQSRLPYLFNQILNHPNTTDELRRATESKLLQHRTNYLHSLPLTEEFRSLKQNLKEEVDGLVRGVILLQIPSELAWNLYFEEQDCETMAGYDNSLMKQMIRLLPGSSLAITFTGYFRYISEPVSAGGKGKEGDEKQLTQNGEEEDPFDTIMNAFSTFHGKVSVCRIAAEVYLNEGDYENASKVAKSGLGLLAKIEQNSGKNLPLTRVGFQAILATALVHLFPPKHHQLALPILQEALSVSPENIRCLLSRAYILQAAEDWIPAAELFERIAILAPSDLDDGLKAREEQAWSHWQTIHEDADIQSLKSVFDILDGLDGRGHDAARCLWRIGRCLWDQGKEKWEEAYSFFINSLKHDSSFAPAFTSLGLYYTEAVSPPDPVRASKCFQKAFELDPQENTAARRLAESFAEDGEWDLVEVVARRAIEGEGGIDTDIKGSESSVVRFVPTNAWAWKAVGVIEMKRRNYLPAVQAFQVTLRAEPNDSPTWLRLGEAYHKAGRHAAAMRVLNRTLELDPRNWVCSFFIGELMSETGLFQEAIDIFGGILEQRPHELCVLAALSRTHVSLGRTESREGYHVRAETSFLDAIDVALAVIEYHPGFRATAWKVISDATFQLCQCAVFQDKARTGITLGTIRSLLSKEHEATSDLPPLKEFGSSLSFVFLGVFIHTCGLRLILNMSSSTARGSAWYDLAIGLQLWYSKATTPKASVEKKNVEAITNALKEEPMNGLYWNAYGNAHFSGHPKVSQHAYVKALELDPKNVITWTNLGFLYYYHDDLELANEALYRAQVIDPDYSLAWLGQALIATANGHDVDAGTLLTHATTLTSSLPDIDIGFATRVFYESRVARRGTDTKVDLFPCFFALDRYCSRRPSDASGLHLFSLMCERIGQIDLAISLARRAISVLEAAYEESENETIERHFTIVHTTLGRLLLSTGRYDHALESFQTALGLLAGSEGTEGYPVAEQTKALRVQAYLGLGLAYFMLQDYQNSLNASQEALNIAGDDITIKGQIIVLFGQTLWALGTEEMREAAKSQLLEYIAVDPGNIFAINALAGMGILTRDTDLIDAALSEVRELLIDQRQELGVNREVVYLLVQHHLSQGKVGNASSVAQKEVFSEPGRPEPRIQLASLMIQRGKMRGARASLVDLIFSNGKDDLSSTSAALTLHSITLCSPGGSARDKATSLREIQRAIMLRPFDTKSWQALGYIRSYVGAT